MTKEFQSTRFGLISYQEDQVIHFPNGLIGFEHCTHFHPIHEEKEQPILFYLQSLEDPDISFNVVDSSYLNLEYQISLSDQEMQLLELGPDAQEDDVKIMLMVYRPLEVKNGEISEKNTIKAQTQSPLIINLNKRIAFQKIGLRSRLIFTNVDEGTEV
jgi:flagellar assembly factor FliW